MIRLTLVLLAGLIGSMLVFGTETPEMQAEAITAAVLDAQAAEPDAAVAAAEPTAVITEPDPEPAVEVTRLQTVDLTSVEPTNALRVLEAPDAPADARAPVQVPDGAKLLVVAGSSVNMRAGPSTSRDVVGNLRRGEKAELLAEAADGWLQIRDVASGRVGFMAARFLTPAN